jgi:hypothetical protein
VLAFPVESRSDTPSATGQGIETQVAKRKSESLAGTERLMKEVCELENCKQALQRVKANKGSPGVHGMTVDELPEYLKQHGLEIGEQLTLPGSAFRRWSEVLAQPAETAVCGPACTVVGEGLQATVRPIPIS